MKLFTEPLDYIIMFLFFFFLGTIFGYFWCFKAIGG